MRITAQLIDALSDAHLWADRFDGSLEDVFDLQDKVASSVAGVIEPTLQTAEIRRSAERPTHDLTAYDLYLRALAHIRSWDKDGISAALDLLGRAIERDPRYGPALALSAYCRVQINTNAWTDDQETNRREGVHLARLALQVSGDDPGVLGNAAYALGFFGEDIHAAIVLIDSSLSLNPSFANGWQRSGWLRLWAGQPDLAINHFETALRLCPRHLRTGVLVGIGVAHFFARRFEEASAMLRQSLQEHPRLPPAYRFLAATYAHMGRLDEAHEIVRRLRAITPVIVPDATHWRNSEQRDLYLEGLRLGAGQET